MEEQLASQDTHTSVPQEMLVYESMDSQKWFLCENPATGLTAVKSMANPQCGGLVSYFEVESFLAGGDGPEREAFRKLLRQDHLATILVACDIHTQHGRDDLAEVIQSLGAWWHHLETVWIVRSDKTPQEIRDKLAAHISADDQLLVIDITRAGAEWAGLNEAGSLWLKANIDRDTLVA
jgi:hypothetical protein